MKWPERDEVAQTDNKASSFAVHRAAATNFFLI